MYKVASASRITEDIICLQEDWFIQPGQVDGPLRVIFLLNSLRTVIQQSFFVLLYIPPFALDDGGQGIPVLLHDFRRA